MSQKNNFNTFIKYIIENIDVLGFFEKYPDIDKKSILNSLHKLSNDNNVSKIDTVQIYTDGASRGNPGQAGAGFVFFNSKNEIIFKGRKFLGVKTNNEAEYLALILALEKLKDFNAKEIKIFADSELLVKQLNGVYKVRNARLKPLFNKVINLLEKYKFNIFHIPREENKLADKLANEAIDFKS